MILWALGFSVLGLLLGPFLGIATDRLIDRVAPQLELRCSSCGHGLGIRSLIPVFHWRQKCAECGSGLGARYVSVDLLAAIVFGLLAVRFGVSFKLVPYLFLGAVLVVLTVVDSETHLLPNIVVWPSIWVAIPTTLILSQVLDDARFAAAVMGGIVFGGFIGLSHIAYARGMGRGDVKLALLLGLFVGWVSIDLLDAVRLVLYAMVLALLGGALLGLAFNAVMKRGKAEIPFGPALAAASLTIIITSQTILSGFGG